VSSNPTSSAMNTEFEAAMRVARRDKAIGALANSMASVGSIAHASAFNMSSS